MKKVSLLIVFLGCLMGHPAFAESWQKIVVCEGGAAYVDVNLGERTNLQLVIRGNEVLSRMYYGGFISLNYGQHEYLLRGYHAELKQVTPTVTQAQSLSGIFYPHDFKKMISEDWNGNAIEIELRGSELAFKKLSYTSGYSCSDPTGCYDGGSQTFHKTYSYQRAYVFRGCQLTD